jgi:hypothetical protein
MTTLTEAELDRIEQRRREWGGAFSLTLDEGKALLAAATERDG